MKGSHPRPGLGLVQRSSVPSRSPISSYYLDLCLLTDCIKERYHSLAPMYYRGARAAIVVYDVTDVVRKGGRE